MTSLRVRVPSLSKIVVAAIVAAAFFVAPVAPAAADEASIVRGGRLYDKWWAENKADKPTATHPSYAGKEYKDDATWRCKECHGWDLKGKDGAYGSGKHFTGIKGLTESADKDPAAIAAILRDKTHAYTPAMLSDANAMDLANFVSKGQVDMADYISSPSLKSTGNAAKGKAYFETICVGCHGLDGKKVADAESLGSVASNGVEMMHKVLYGQPKAAMPALFALDHQIAADLVAHLQSLPK